MVLTSRAWCEYRFGACRVLSSTPLPTGKSLYAALQATSSRSSTERVV